MKLAKLAILASTSLCVCLEFAQAADMEMVRKAPIAAPDSWVGFYAGGNLGRSWGKVNALQPRRAV